MPKATFDTDDAADALAIAICHAHHRQSAVSRLAALATAAGALFLTCSPSWNISYK